ncbi:MAG: hypothetical protein QM733_04390 [Ilumatobacteraceae bacterium]
MPTTATHTAPDASQVCPGDRRPGPRRQPRLPIGPLEAWLNLRDSNTSPSADRQLGGRLSGRRIAELIGVHQGIVQRWRADGVPLHAADRAAINAGTHPLAIWPDFHTIGTDRP